MEKQINIRVFGELPDGRAVHAYELSAGNGASMTVLDYGCIMQSLCIPLGDGTVRDVVLGFRDIATYLEQPYFGPVVGRVCNRIAGGRFTLDNTEYVLPLNNDPGGIPCCLHGGNAGLNAHIWQAEPFTDTTGVGIIFGLKLPDGADGFPGNAAFCVRYTLTTENVWRIEYFVTTDKACPINLTQHAIFSLQLDTCRDILYHKLQVLASRYAPVTPGLIPLGNPEPVLGTPFDFTKPCRIGARIDSANEQLGYGKGYDHHFAIDAWDGTLRKGAVLTAPDDLSMEVWTTEPGMQVYSGNWIPAGLSGKYGEYGPRSGIALETQHCPNSVNNARMPSVILQPGNEYRSMTEYRFGKVNN